MEVRAVGQWWVPALDILIMENLKRLKRRRWKSECTEQELRRHLLVLCVICDACIDEGSSVLQ